MFNKQISIFILMMLLIVGTVTAFTIVRNTPAAYETSTTPTITFNISCNMSAGDNSTYLNATIYAKTDRTGSYNWSIPYGIFLNNSNGSVSYAVTQTFADEERVWWKASCFDLNSEYNQENESLTLSTNGSQIDLGNDTYGVTNITGWVNFTSNTTYRPMVLDADYNITGNLVYLINASINGNLSLWNYTWPYNSTVNQVNSTVRILDIDTDYYTLSFGANQLINMSLDTGEITASSIITSLLFTNTSYDWLGINTTTPTSTLHVQGNANISGAFTAGTVNSSTYYTTNASGMTGTLDVNFTGLSNSICNLVFSNGLLTNTNCTWA